MNKKYVITDIDKIIELKHKSQKYFLHRQSFNEVYIQGYEDAYNELMQRKDIEEALEKQIPKKPNLEADGYADGELVYDTWICPCCQTHYEIETDDYKFCPNCGQRIDWSEQQHGLEKEKTNE